MSLIFKKKIDEILYKFKKNDLESEYVPSKELIHLFKLKKDV